MRQWAVRGAEARLLELAEEIATIHRTFPELRDTSPRRAGRPGPAAIPNDGPDGRIPDPRRRRRRKMSAEARNRISKAQKARRAREKTKKR